MFIWSDSAGSTLFSQQAYSIFFTIPMFYKDVFVNYSFSRATKPWTSLAIGFPLTYDVNDFKSRLTDSVYLYVLSKQISCMI